MVHGCIVYTERAEKVAVSRGASYVSTKQRCKSEDELAFSGYSKRAMKSYSHSFRITCDMSAVNLPESYIKAINHGPSYHNSLCRLQKGVSPFVRTQNG